MLTCCNEDDEDDEADEEEFNQYQAIFDICKQYLQ